MAGELFGLREDPQFLKDIIAEQEAQDQEVQEQEAQQETSSPSDVDAEPAPEPSSAEEAEVPETVEGEGDQAPPEPSSLILGRYKSVDDLVQAYQTNRGLQQQTAQERNQLMDQLAQQRAMNDELMQRLQSLEQRTPRQLDPEIRKQAEEAGVDETTIALAQRIAEQQSAQQVEERLQPLQQQMYAQQQQAMIQEQVRQRIEAVKTFRSKVADAPVPESPEDVRHSEVFAYFAGMDPEYPLDMNPDTLQITWEATNDPELFEVLVNNPALLDTEQGRAYAHKQATLFKATSQPQALTETPAQTAEPVVETGGSSGAPMRAQPGPPQDDWDKAMALSKPKKGKENIFGVQFNEF